MTPAARQLADAIAETKRGKGRSKWKRDSRGRNHPSGEEADWFDAQYAREQRGEIVIEEIEPAFKIVIPNTHGDHEYAFTVKADMRVRDVIPAHMRNHVPPAQPRWIDYKGRTGDTEVSRLKRRCVLIQHGVEIELVGKYIERKARSAAKKKAERELLKAHKRMTRQRGKR